jgi:hypothetical protein
VPAVIAITSVAGFAIGWTMRTLAARSAARLSPIPVNVRNSRWN